MSLVATTNTGDFFPNQVMKVPKAAGGSGIAFAAEPRKVIYFVNPQNTGAGLLRPDSGTGSFGFTY